MKQDQCGLARMFVVRRVQKFLMYNYKAKCSNSKLLIEFKRTYAYDKSKILRYEIETEECLNFLGKSRTKYRNLSKGYTFKKIK